MKNLISINKDNNKENRLLSTAFNLFLEKGIKNTSIQEIVDNADVAKGTFYLYFKDKYQIRDILIIKHTRKLFNDALTKLRFSNIFDLYNQVIFIVDFVVDELSKNPSLLKFISKNLSWGIYTKTVNKIYEENENEENGILKLFLKGVKDSNLNLKNPEITLYMIIELVSSSCFNSILYSDPLPIDDFKPFLHDAIKSLLNG